MLIEFRRYNGLNPISDCDSVRNNDCNFKNCNFDLELIDLQKFYN